MYVLRRTAQLVNILWSLRNSPQNAIDSRRRRRRTTRVRLIEWLLSSVVHPTADSRQPRADDGAFERQGRATGKLVSQLSREFTCQRNAEGYNGRY